MKYIIPLLLSFALILSGCGQTGQNSKSDSSSPESSGKLSVVATNFSGYDFAREVAGGNAELEMLLPPGSESHSFEPTPQDIIKIQNCDIFIYVGGDSDTWVEGILDSVDTGNIKIISMMDLVETVPEEIVEGMEDNHGHDHGHSDEFDPADIYDRPLSDWAGSWQTIENALESEAMEEYIAHQAEENGTDFDTQMKASTERWKSDYPALEITGSTVMLNGTAVSYEYIGYKLVESDSGSSVWYGFKAADFAGLVPEYIAFSGHGTGRLEEEHQEEDEHHELAHFHMRCGNDSFDALTKMESWSPTYFPASASNEEIGEAMNSHTHSHEEEYDEHVWTSPANAMLISEQIAQTLCTLDKDNADTYRANSAAYTGRLEKLDTAFREAVQKAERKTLIFGDRFPFRYFADEYGLDYYAAFPGCSTETEAGAKTVAFLIDKVNNENISVVFHIELSNEKMADTICEATGAKKLLLHSCHNITKDEMNSGVSYLDLMSKNVDALKEALQ